MQQEARTMETEELRALFLRLLKQQGCPGLFPGVLRGVGTLKAQQEGETNVNPMLAPRHLSDTDRSRLVELVWSFIIQGILVPGEPGWPSLELTEYGKKCIADESVSPHDHDGFLADFRMRIPQADCVISEYLTEALQCFLFGLYRAAAVMLGGASEKAMLLFEACSDAIADQDERQSFQNKLAKARSLFQKYGEFEKRFEQTKARMPRSLTDNLDSVFRGVWDLIRNSRNDAGHPAGGIVANRPVVYAHLQLFVPWVERIYALIGWFNSNAA